MSQIIYFIPRSSGFKRDDLIKDGLGFAFDSDLIAHRGVSKAIAAFGDTAGSLVSTTDAGLAYKPELQDWYPFTGDSIGDGIYYGWWKDNKPTPAELQRENALPGMEIELDDHNKWMIPIARDYSSADGKLVSSSRLPCKLSLENGVLKQSTVPLDQYRELWEMAERWATHSSISQTVGPDQIIDAAVCITTNYRICTEQLFSLEALTTNYKKVFEILNILTDMEGLGVLLDSLAPADEDQKKTEMSTA